MPTAADKEAYEAVKSTPPSAETHPHTYAWFVLVNRFHDSVRSSWAAAAGAQKGGKAAPAKKEEEPKKTEVAAADDDDELDLFGDSGPTEVRLIYLIGGYKFIINRKKRNFSKNKRERLKKQRKLRPSPLSLPSHSFSST